MMYRPNYVPKQKKKLNYKVVVPLVVLFALGMYIIVATLIKNETPQETGYAICGLNDYDSRKLLEKRQEEVLKNMETLPMNDYGVYGESLTLYQNAFSFNTADPMIGRTVTLTNLCKPQEQFTFLFGSNLDMRIPLDTLPEGFYDVDVLADLKHYALVSDATLTDTFSTVVRDGLVNNATIHATQDLFDIGEEKVLNKNYVFLEVKSAQPAEEEYDIVLDPAGGSIQYNGTSDPGNTYGEFIERDEMYTAAVEIKSILESHGLRVLIARDNITPVNVFGAGGRIYDAYNFKAKYYIQLQLGTSGSSMDRGMMSLFSNHASNRLSTSIVNSLLRSTSLQTTPYDDGDNINGVFRTSSLSGFDYNDVVRETGGKFTGSGLLDEDFSELQGFAKDFRNGMYGITLLYGYLTDGDDYHVWSTEKDKIIEATAQGILDQLNIGGEN
ncbi:hypothetical protein AOC36_03425 [Erysipelothrix larvae]|uniref:Uncharacterized protein n=1 Tax=Erysipelothrix larvae TaxID=1514105 RepID=A0A0X8GZE4_9FIRM|nr:N-acetylmuramoyl-L-alanine amidase [Erysipelothrix larvae]AMC93059.1 hypothetical protein AOC36_03425 [Erysipelothrix larvae]